jgi:hypothetical protein
LEISTLIRGEVDISDPTKNQQPSATMKKRKPHPKEKRKPEHKTKLMSCLNNGIGHIHVQGLFSIATCMALTTYHSIPTDFISSLQWMQLDIRC